MTRAAVIKLIILGTATILCVVGILQLETAAQREHDTMLIQQLKRETQVERCQAKII